MGDVHRSNRSMEGGHPSVLQEFAGSPGAKWVPRTRVVPSKAFDWMSYRVERGLRFAVAARIRDIRGYTLLVRMNPETAWTRDWVTPGGGAEPGETPREAVMREIGEEAGIRVRDLQLWKVFHESVRGPGGRVVTWDFLQYTARWASGVPHSRVPEEIVEVRWFSRLPANMAFRSDWLRPRFGPVPPLAGKPPICARRVRAGEPET